MASVLTTITQTVPYITVYQPSATPYWIGYRNAANAFTTTPANFWCGGADEKYTLSSSYFDCCPTSNCIITRRTCINTNSIYDGKSTTTCGDGLNCNQYYLYDNNQSGQKFLGSLAQCDGLSGLSTYLFKTAYATSYSTSTKVSALPASSSGVYVYSGGVTTSLPPPTTFVEIVTITSSAGGFSSILSSASAGSSSVSATSSATSSAGSSAGSSASSSLLPQSSLQSSSSSTDSGDAQTNIATTSSSTSATPTPIPESSSKAWIAGAVIGPVVGVALLAGLLWFLLSKRRKSGGNAMMNPTSTSEMTNGTTTRA